MCARVIAVVGAGDATDAPHLLPVAESVGARLAAAGAVLVCGGMGGVMEAAARGARSGGGVVIGILPGENRAAGNAHLTVAIPTAMGEGRNVLVARAADALIAIGGEYGTLSEIALALKLGRTVVGIDTWELGRSGTADDAIIRVADAGEAVAAALAATEDRRGRGG